MLLYDKPYHP